tara:strand:- start:7781 stop:8446 length:666 start_codon:yes stop_codon:yes gene_type:complete
MDRLERKGKTSKKRYSDKDAEMSETELLDGKNEEELEELVDYDGSMMNSKIPLGINKSNKISRSTSDDMVKTAYQKGNGFGYYYKRYWGEAYLGGGLGDNEELDSEVETTNDCMEYFMGNYGLSREKSVKKCENYGYDTDVSQEKAENDERKRLVELSNKKMKDMMEVILSKKNDDEGIKRGVDVELHDRQDYPILDKMGSKFKKACDAQGIDPNEILNKF